MIGSKAKGDAIDEDEPRVLLMKGGRRFGWRRSR